MSAPERRWRGFVTNKKDVKRYEAILATKDQNKRYAGSLSSALEWAPEEAKKFKAVVEEISKEDAAHDRDVQIVAVLAVVSCFFGPQDNLAKKLEKATAYAKKFQVPVEKLPARLRDNVLAAMKGSCAAAAEAPGPAQADTASKEPGWDHGSKTLRRKLGRRSTPP